MRIRLNQILPNPLTNDSVEGSSIWGQELIFEKGNFIEIKAQSGQGKSTLLHIIYGLRFDFEGTCEIDGKSTATFSKEKWREVWSDQLSLVFQDLRLFMDLTARQNLELLPAFHKPNPDLMEMCEQINIAHLLDQPVGTLSLGQRQRFALVRSLLKPFDWLLLDEPFSHLDKENAERTAKLIESIVRSRNAGIIYTSLMTHRYLACNQSMDL